MSQMGSRTNPAMLIEIAQKLMGSLALMTAAFWSELTKQGAKCVLVQEDKGQVHKQPDGDLCTETEGNTACTRTAPTSSVQGWQQQPVTQHGSGMWAGNLSGSNRCNMFIWNTTTSVFWGIELNCQKMTLEGHRLDFGVNKFFCILQVLATSVKELSCTHSVHCCTELCFFYV